VLNRPLNYIDPSGHIPTRDDDTRPCVQIGNCQDTVVVGGGNIEIRTGTGGGYANRQTGLSGSNSTADALASINRTPSASPPAFSVSRASVVVGILFGVIGQLFGPANIQGPADRANQTATSVPGPGVWTAENESMSSRARDYQERVTGASRNTVYEVNGVKFDGYQGGTLIDAKGPGYDRFLESNGAFKPWFSGANGLVNDANRQLAAANGVPIQWRVAEERTANAIRDLFAANGVNGIDVVYTP
jgi:hypothetical protein